MGEHDEQSRLEYELPGCSDEIGGIGVNFDPGLSGKLPFESREKRLRLSIQELVISLATGAKARCCGLFAAPLSELYTALFFSGAPLYSTVIP